MLDISQKEKGTFNLQEGGTQLKSIFLGTATSLIASNFFPLQHDCAAEYEGRTTADHVSQVPVGRGRQPPPDR